MKLKLNFLFLTILSSIAFVHGQELDSISMEFEGGLVVVKYDFLVGEEGENYELYLYGSHDNFSEPLQYTTGDVGKNIQIGKSKVIRWDAKRELGNFKGDFSLKIKGSKYVPLVTFDNINSNLKIKRGNTFVIKWIPNTKDKEVLLKIQKSNVPISKSQIVENSGLYSWNLPADLKPGDTYSVQILDTKNLIREETSENFTVKRKIPLVYKIVPIAVAGGVAAVLLLNNDESGIPEPPAPPSN